MRKKGILIRALLTAVFFGVMFSSFADAVNFDSVISEVYYLSFWLIVPIVLIEAIVAYLLAGSVLDFELSFKFSLFIFTIANFASTFVGFFFSQINTIPWSFPSFFFMAYLLSVFVELPILYFFLKRRTKKPVVNSVMILLSVNFISYMFILLYLALTGGLN